MTKELEKMIEDYLKDLDNSSKITAINSLREAIHRQSPFKNEPVDFVKWVQCDNVVSNDYNPNKVAPPEMELLEISIMNDGYTQPIVTWENDDKGKIEVIDGFHRNRVGKESKIVNQRIMGYLPIVNIRTEQSNKNDRIASTIRHNRARGKHQVDAMSEIVIELKNRNWTNQRIAKQLGMDEEEVLRLCQISGLEHLFTDSDFSKSWESSDYEDEFQSISDKVSLDEMGIYKIPNELDTDRIFHTYDKWECHKAGFYNNKKENWTDEMCKNEYVKVLSNSELFEILLQRVISEWKYSCEHYLTNKSMNRIAWLGQAAVCINSGVPSIYSSAWNLLSDEQKDTANKIADIYLNKWLTANGRSEISLNEAMQIGRQIELY
jgi:hypothetical protein